MTRAHTLSADSCWCEPFYGLPEPPVPEDLLVPFERHNRAVGAQWDSGYYETFDGQRDMHEYHHTPIKGVPFSWWECSILCEYIFPLGFKGR